VFRRGLTLLEVLVALVILSMVVVGYLELFHGGHALVLRSREWSAAVGYAVDGMEQAKLAPGLPQDERRAALPNGFQREIVTRAWQPGLELLTVTVLLPSGGHFDVYRLEEIAPNTRAGVIDAATR
jgi:prepilin-type N-terminal cleavage/methylation domain-containing protein